MSGSIGGSKQKQSSQSQNSTNIWGPQGSALQGAFDRGQNLYDNNLAFQDTMNNLAGIMTGNMQGTLEGAQAGMDNMLAGGSVQNSDEIMSALMNSLNQTSGGSQTGKMYESIVGGQGNTYVDPMVEAMKRGAMENNAMMQAGNAMDASAMGQGGSSRHAMQNAMTNKATNQQMLDQEMMMRGGAYDTDLAMKMDIARQADQGIQGTQDRLMGLLGMSDANKQQGMGYGNTMLGMTGQLMNPWQQAMGSGWNNYNNYRNGIGSAIMESQGTSSGSGSGKAMGVTGSGRG